MIVQKKTVKTEAVKHRVAPKKQEGYNVLELSNLAEDKQIPEAELDDVIKWLIQQDDGGYNDEFDLDGYKKDFEEDKLKDDEKYIFIGWMTEYLILHYLVDS